MSAAGYPPDRIEAVLRKASLPDCYRIMPVGFLASPLGTVPSDSRFCSRDAGYAVLYATPDFATAFVETVVRDRFARSRLRDVALAAGLLADHPDLPDVLARHDIRLSS